MHADYIANPLYDNNPFIEASNAIRQGLDSCPGGYPAL